MLGHVLQGRISLVNPCGNGLWSRVRHSLLMVLQSNIWGAQLGNCAHSLGWIMEIMHSGHEQKVVVEICC